MKKHSTITRNISKFLFVSVAIGFLSSCMSTTQFASRKYTKGHFSDPIAKVNVDLLPSGANTAVAASGETQAKTIIAQNTKKSVASAPVAETRLNTAPKQQVSFTRQAKSVKIALANSPSVTNKDNVSLSDNAITAVTDHHDSGNGGSGSGHVWLRYALICLIIALIATIVGAIVFFGGAFLLAYLLYVIAGVAWLGFVIFMILWLVELLGGM